MNIGYLSGYYSDYSIINTAFLTAAMTYNHAASADYSGWGSVIVPRYATHVLVTASARGGSHGGYSDAAGGGGASCFRVSFPIRDYKYFPYAFGDASFGGVIVGSNGTYSQMDQYHSYRLIDRMDGIVLMNGANAGTAGGGAGGAATYYTRHGAAAVSTIIATGGAGGSKSTNFTIGDDGKVICLPDGGVIAGGGGGGGYTGTASPTGSGGGSVSTPWGNSHGTSQGGHSHIQAGQAYPGGGSSMFSRGTDYYNGHNLPGAVAMGSAYYAIPGGGQGPWIVSGDQVAYKSSAFIYMEFIAPADMREAF